MAAPPGADAGEESCDQVVANVAQGANHHSRGLARSGQTREVERLTPVHRAGKKRRADRAWALRFGSLGAPRTRAVADGAHEGEELLNDVEQGDSSDAQARLMPLPELIVLADLDVECSSPGPTPVPGLQVEVYPQVARLQRPSLSAPRAAERRHGPEQTIAPPVQKFSAHPTTPPGPSASSVLWDR